MDFYQVLRDLDKSLVNKDHIKEYVTMLNDIQSHSDSDDIDLVEKVKLLIETIAREDVSVVIARIIFSYLTLQVFPSIGYSRFKILGHFLLEKLRLRTSYFKDEVLELRKTLSSVYENEKNWIDAILMLDQNLIEIDQKTDFDDHKLQTYIKIALLYLNADKPLLAETYIRKASYLQTQTNNENLQILYKEVYAQVLDSCQKFADAAQRFVELLYRPNITESEIMITLKSTLVCTILSPVGETRSRILSTLYKDERCKSLIRFSILEKLYLCRIIKPNEIDELETMLSPHQKTKTKDNTSILTEVMIEHNILSVSKLFRNIKIESLGNLLNIEPRKAETKAGKMISEGLMEGSIDQIAGFIYFKRGANLIQTWDKDIESLCCHINHIIEVMSADESTREWMNNYIDNQMS